MMKENNLCLPYKMFKIVLVSMSERRHLTLAVVTDICDEDVTYPSCRQCCSKLFLDDLSPSQRYRCLKCGSCCSKQHVQYRYRLVLAVSDGGVTGRVVVFGRTLEAFFGKTATDFHRSVFELGKSGYPAEAMLWEALMKTFHGKYFYFGMKTTTNPASHDPPTLSDVLNIPDHTDSDAEPSQGHRDTSHTLVYQMIQCNDGAYATVTDHMRFTVNTLRRVRKGEALTQGVSASPFLTLCRAEPTKANNESHAKLRADDTGQKSCSLTDSHFESSSLCKTSSLYSKQLSVMFSFENDSHASESVTSTVFSVEGSTGNYSRQRDNSSYNEERHFQSHVISRYTDVTSQHSDIASIHADVEIRNSDVTNNFCDVGSRLHAVARRQSDEASIHSDVASQHSEIENRLHDTTSRHCDVESRHNDEASGCSIEGFVSFASQDERQDLCLSTMDAFPVTQKLNFTNANDMHGSPSNSSYIVIDDAHLNIPYVHTKPETMLCGSCGRSGQHNASQCNGVNAATEVVKALKNNQTQDASVANLYLPDSEGLSAFLDTFEEEPDMSDCQGEVTSEKPTPTKGLSARSLSPIHNHTEGTEHSEDNDYRQGNTDSYSETKSKFSENVREENKEAAISSRLNMTDSCLSESEIRDVSSALDTKDQRLSDTEDDLEAFLNSFDETMGDGEEPNILRVNRAYPGSENQLNASHEAETQMPRFHLPHSSDLQKGDVQGLNISKESRRGSQQLSIERKELHSNADTREETMNRSNHTFAKLNTMSEFRESITEEDSGFSQPEDLQECNAEKTMSVVSKYVHTTSNHDVQINDIDAVHQAMLNKDNPSLGKSDQARAKVAPQVMCLIKDKKETKNAHISKNDSNDLEMFFSEISLKGYERNRDTILSTEKYFVPTDSVDSRSLPKGTLNVNSQTSQPNLPGSLASRITSFADGTSSTPCTIETVIVNQPAVDTPDPSSIESLDVAKCNKSHYENQKTSLCKNRNRDSASSVSDNKLNPQTANDAQKNTKTSGNVDKALSLQLDFSADLFEDSSDMYTNNDVFGVVNESSQKCEEETETADTDKENQGLESEIVIIESQDMQQISEKNLSVDHDFQPVRDAPAETESPASTKRVQFDRRLQRVTSCQLMDVQMRQRGSPSDRLRRKSILKPCLKVEDRKDVECEKLSVKTPVPGVLTESFSHSASSPIDTIGSMNNHNIFIHKGNKFSQFEHAAEMSYTDGSQDLFGPSPISGNDRHVANDVSHSNSSRVETDTETPDLFVSRESVLKKGEQQSIDPVMTPDIFSQDSWFDISPSSPAVLSDGVMNFNIDQSDKISNRPTETTDTATDVAAQKTNKKYRYLIEDTPVYDKPDTVVRKLGIASLTLAEKAATGSPSSSRPVLREVVDNCQDTPDLFDSPDFAGGCGDFDQAFVSLPDQSSHLAKQLFF